MDSVISSVQALEIDLPPHALVPASNGNSARAGISVSELPAPDPPAVCGHQDRGAAPEQAKAQTPEVVASLAPKPASARYESLTLWRGVACMTLLLYHATFYAEHSWRSADPSTWTWSGLAVNLLDRLWMGVPLFFVVSGYCIAANVDALRRRPHSLANYFWRRFRRIYPPYWAALGLGVLFTLVVMGYHAAFESCAQLPRLPAFANWNWIGNFTASETWLPRLASEPPAFILRNTWTLCYEEQFYAVTGLLLAFAARRFFVAAYGVALLTLVLRHTPHRVDIDGFFFDGHWLMFCAGVLVYERLNYFGRFGSRVSWVVLALGALYGAALRILSEGRQDRHFGEYVLAACVFAMVLILLRRWDALLISHWSLSPLAWCGKISYSIFLIHFPVVVLLGAVFASIGIRSDDQVLLVTVPISVAVSVPLAWLFHLAVERRFLNHPVESPVPHRLISHRG